MSTGPIAVMYSRRTSVCPSPSSSICSASRRCRSASTPSFCSPGSTPSSCCESCRISWIEITSRSAVFAWVTRQSSIDARLGALVVDLVDREHGGRAHPVERLVAQRVGVHEHAAVVLEHEQPGRERQVRAQPAGVVDGAAGNDETHGDEFRRASPAPVRNSGDLPVSAPARSQSTRNLLSYEPDARAARAASRRARFSGSRAAGIASVATMIRPSTIHRALSTPMCSPTKPMSGGPMRNAA